VTVAIDGSTLDVPDTEENRAYFGRQKSSRGQAAFPQLRFVSLCECGPRAIFALRVGPYRTHESSLAQELIGELKPGMLCLADRLYANFSLWQKAAESGAALLWRTRSNAKLPLEQVLSDGSYLSRIYPSEKAQRQKRDGLVVRVIEYELEGVEAAEPLYRLITTLLESSEAPAEELAGLYPQRWEIETVLDEFKTHLRGGQVVLRSKTPQLIEQEFYGMMLAHRAVRTLVTL